MQLSSGARRCFSTQRLSRSARACYQALYNRRGEDNPPQCCPLQSELAKELGVGERQVGHYIKELREAGLIDVKKYGQAAATYTILGGKQ